MSPDRRARLLEVVRLFTRLGLTAFGGPAAHTAMMHDEVATRRSWCPNASSWTCSPSRT